MLDFNFKTKNGLFISTCYLPIDNYVNKPIQSLSTLQIWKHDEIINFYLLEKRKPMSSLQNNNNTSNNNHHEDTDFVHMTFFYTEMVGERCFLRTRLEKMSREEYEAKYAMRDPNRIPSKARKNNA